MGRERSIDTGVKGRDTEKGEGEGGGGREGGERDRA